jgi:hypothetical protein
MKRVFSNGPAKDFVINPFTRLINSASRVFLAAPYFTLAAPIIDAARSGKSIQLLVGLNAATSPIDAARRPGLKLDMALAADALTARQPVP